MTPLSDWEKKIEKRTANIGFRTRAGALREPTESEKASALAMETESWQSTKGRKPYKLSAEYSTSLGVNLRNTNEKPPRIEQAIKAYMETPMDPDGILKIQKIDVTPYENPPTFFQRLKKVIIAGPPPWWEDVLVSFLPIILFIMFAIIFHETRTK